MKRFVCTKLVTAEDGERNPHTDIYTGVNRRIWSNDEVDRCMLLGAFQSLSAVKSDPNAYVWPELPLGVSWSIVPQDTKNEIAAAVRRFGFDFYAAGSWSIKEVIEHVVHQVRPGVDIEVGDVFDPWG